MSQLIPLLAARFKAPRPSGLLSVSALTPVISNVSQVEGKLPRRRVCLHLMNLIVIWCRPGLQLQNVKHLSAGSGFSRCRKLREERRYLLAFCFRLKQQWRRRDLVFGGPGSTFPPRFVAPHTLWASSGLINCEKRQRKGEWNSSLMPDQYPLNLKPWCLDPTHKLLSVPLLLLLLLQVFLLFGAAGR